MVFQAEWWVGERAHRGIGSGAVEVEMWRLRVFGSGMFDIQHSLSSESWQLVRTFQAS